jgi:hypothetical protein
MVDGETINTDGKMLQLIYYDLSFKYLSIKLALNLNNLLKPLNSIRIKINTIP